MANENKGGGKGGRRSKGPGKGETRQFVIPAPLVDHILLGPADDRRVLQDSPVLGDVWQAYALDPGKPHDLLITPHRNATAAEIAKYISDAVRKIGRKPEREKSARVAYLQGIVAVRLYFDELLRILVPQTLWWSQRKVEEILAKLLKEQPDEIRSRVRRLLAPESFRQAAGQAGAGLRHENFTALDRYIALAGLVLWAVEQRRSGKELDPKAEIEKVFDQYMPNVDRIVDGMLELYQAILSDAKAAKESPESKSDQEEKEPLIFQISLNRPATAALEKSVPAVKGDAACRLFDIKCNKIAWAVIDSGILGTHDAFNDVDEKGKTTSRIRKTLDFTNVREIVSSDSAEMDDTRLEELLQGVRLDKDSARKHLEAIAADARDERPTNWGLVEKLITLADPRPPVSPHGTHVAGIIGANAKTMNEKNKTTYASGMCPDIRLYDLRVLGKTIQDTEFAVIAALQYIRHVNERHSSITIHGANLSLSIPHSVRNFACGQTPVCNECERLVDNGVVVVAAAGNRGHQKFETKDGIFESYAAFSITDPGNGDGVLTVGATHGNWPHTYGVSFFSSRGPTGDGRMKPDLVAPGERVTSTVLNNDWGQESGTSMAAPLVSGAAAMLLARYPELIGAPRRVKRILCESATDLGRERSFQGHGMLDVLRAFQSI